MGIQDDPGVDEVPGGYSLIQGLAKGNGSRHVCRMLERMPLGINRIYLMQQTRPFLVKPNE